MTVEGRMPTVVPSITDIKRVIALSLTRYRGPLLDDLTVALLAQDIQDFLYDRDEARRTAAR